MGAYEIEKFIRGEVKRQGFIREPSHSEHVKYMLRAWGYAEGRLDAGFRTPSEDDIKEIAHRVQPYTNHKEYRGTRVRVGDWVAPPPVELERLMEAWAIKTAGGGWEKPDWLKAGPGSTWEADEAYRQFELIHPFEDGNGRTGKIIHNWLLNRLWDPTLVQDFFGRGVP